MCATKTIRSRLPARFLYLETVSRIWISTIESSSAIRTGRWMYRRRYVHSCRLMTFPAKRSFRSARMRDTELAQQFVIHMKTVGGGYAMFGLGVLVSYFLIFPLTFRFLGTYQVSGEVDNLITLGSYISTLVMMCLMMGIVSRY